MVTDDIAKQVIDLVTRRSGVYMFRRKNMIHTLKNQIFILM